jgi:2,3-bisphosphoglycerate-independent phosphoglycerate mutase
VEELNHLIVKADTKIVLVVIDGLGGMRTDERGSELHAARTPHLDSLAREGSIGLQTVVASGVTPGSGAGHLALFGYDPLVYQLGRGALSAAGVGFDLKPDDVAARVNFCTLHPSGVIADRRAGRISTDENERLCRKILDSIDLEGRAELFLVPEREHRALLVLRGSGLSHEVADTDPQVAGVAPLRPTATSPAADVTAALLADALTQIGEILKDEVANFILLRGFDTVADLPSFEERYRLDAFGIAGYPMYIGIARILGFDVAPPQANFLDEVDVLEDVFPAHEFFYIHQKRADSAGEDGDFDRKVAAIEEVDMAIPLIAGLRPDVLCVTGDHATPSQMRAHSWHPVPFVMWGPRVGRDAVDRFDEEAGAGGAFGHIRGKELMFLMLAAAGRLLKFGA